MECIALHYWYCRAQISQECTQFSSLYLSIIMKSRRVQQDSLRPRLVENYCTLSGEGDERFLRVSYLQGLIEEECWHRILCQAFTPAVPKLALDRVINLSQGIMFQASRATFLANFFCSSGDRPFSSVS